MSAHQAKKRFGQNFLHDPNVIDRIVRTLNPQPQDNLIEIGPGLGALTAPLLARAGKLTVVEIDRDVIPHLQTACNHSPDLTIVEADALKQDYRQLAAPGARLRLVGNLPYNISTPLLFHLLEQASAIIDMHFMLQKEVVERMCAAPGDDAYGRLSVALAARCQVDYLFHVGPGAFKPAPKVDSAIVRLIPRAPDFEIADQTRFDELIRLAFSQRRKTLSNALKGHISAEQFTAANVDPRARAETLHARDFARLCAV
ncbi:16S rRNA (adenine(1518)-N(6)/adenine(1519)-N(6))-dimethyltransferase RsmA [Sinimarinibacterium sp. NLF-5-8]|uniref:16S rRNA (adenine(1518)-N(6)/adenine(1519)-N(6))- dimethyltransferase RsmA n=1 Tax=Sinimarinibacterium sp. NLF-5-8 TaxID=2698684 RepID=UPI00137C18E7|nr:16S rRNA (adenine(1518)-N(6)/adenine(1519)-N(6))-dimethyltransferase RsmA [Sinimarinibacterium sp. NLF-5-8]QHS10470.1 16S rRNA (adenine(1518)-N(6)/adenine(1519)-N(6))-dimethyltransferase RsmA [Sinimarinibacterium sp. NLF-5-8]